LVGRLSWRPLSFNTQAPTSLSFPSRPRAFLPLAPLNFSLDGIAKKIRAFFAAIKDGINPRQRARAKTGRRRFRRIATMIEAEA
jgi:hypothetical protein